MTGILKKQPATIKKGSGSADHADQPQHEQTDILIDRFLEYKSITKGLTAYYEDLAKLETHAASELEKLGGHLPVPLREGNQFLPEGGWQTILYNTREQSRLMAEHHTQFAHAITHNVVQALTRTKGDIKNFIAELVAEPSRLATEVGKHRAESTELLTKLAESIAHAKSNPHALTAKDDPVLLHRHVETQLKAQVLAENSLTQSVILYQKKSAEFEKRVNLDIQTAAGAFETARVICQDATAQEWKNIHAGLTGLKPELEWDEFAKRSNHLIPEDITMRDPSKISFPGQEDETTKPIKAGLLERKKRFTKNYKEGFYVLTPSGYLHEHKSSDPSKHGEPELSIFLPNCVLGPAAPEGAKSFKFHVEGKKKTSGGYQTGSLSRVKHTLRLGKKDVAFSFKARTHQEMTEWWNLMQHPAKASYTAATTKSGLKEGTAVAAVTRVGLESDNSASENANGPATVTRKNQVLSDDEPGGSSEDEGSTHTQDELSTAPTTPAAAMISHQDSVKIASDHPSEALPGYKLGNSPTTAMVDLKQKPGLNRTIEPAEPSTSH